MKLFDLFKKKHKKPFDISPELLAVKLFFANKPEINEEKIISSLERRFQDVEVQDLADRKNGSTHYFFKDYEVDFDEGKLPAQGVISIPETDGIEFEKLDSSFQQSWNWVDAKVTVHKCKYEILLTDVLSKNLDYKLRLECFQKFVSSIVETLNPDAIWITNAEKLMQQEEYLENISANNYQNLIGLINVRLYDFSEVSGETIMDTIGLNVLGLPDLEIKFKDFDPSQMAGLLFNYGSYLYEKGFVIKNESTIQGIEQHHKWKCNFKTSYMEPERRNIELKV